MTNPEAEPEILIYAWPKGVPKPPNARDGMAELIEGDEDFVYPPLPSERSDSD
jgi:hypothetical protein